MSRRLTLPIATPCPEASRLTGDGVTLRCERCDKAVYDLSAMSQAQATVFLRALVGRPKPCVRYRMDTRGDILFRRPVTPSPQGWAAAVAAGAVIALTAGPSAAMAEQPDANEPPAAVTEPTDDQAGAPAEVPPSCPLPDPALPGPAEVEVGEVLGGVPPESDDYYATDGERPGKHRRWLRRIKRKERRAKRRGRDLAALD